MTGKRRRRSMETPYARITEIREVGTSGEANECLGSGFVLIKAVEKRETDALGRQTSAIIYILGKLKGNGNGHPAQPAKPQPADIMHGAPDVDPAVLEDRPWKKYDNGDGEWTFIVNQDGSPVAELEPARDFLETLRAGEDLVVGGYKYRLRDRFLKRYPVSGQSA
ncbi:MAG: hypothetical protein JRN45_04230 [Nitrososphaerota archaeon]|nr:hypothetical protein [Nitrososphaerota archaeon]